MQRAQGETKSATSAAWSPVSWSRWRSWAVAGSVTVGAVVVTRAFVTGRTAPVQASEVAGVADNTAPRTPPGNHATDQALREWLRAPVVPPARNLFAAPPAP